MPYTIKTVEVGDYKTTYIYCERPVATSRGKKVKTTDDLQSKLNERMSEAMLRDIIHLNFDANDFALRIDYHRFIGKNGGNPDLKQAQSRVSYFFKKLRTVYDAYGIKLEYLYVTEVGVRSGKVHHHVVLRGSEDASVRMYLRQQAEALWAHGYANTQPLTFDENGLKGLVHYFIKEPSTTRRWACSLGLKRPSEENGMVRRRRSAISAKAAKYIDEHPFDDKFIIEKVLGTGWVPAQVRTTAISTREDMYPSDIPGETDKARNIWNGYVRPDYGGHFIEIWSYREGTDLFVPIAQDKRLKKAKKSKEVSA